MYPGSSSGLIARFTSKGLDSTFATEGFFESTYFNEGLDAINGVMLGADGKIVAAGWDAVYRLTPD